MGVRGGFGAAPTFHGEHSAGTARPRGCALKFRIMAPAFHGEHSAGTARPRGCALKFRIMAPAFHGEHSAGMARPRGCALKFRIMASAFHGEHNAGTARPRGCALKFRIMAPVFHGEQSAGTVRGARRGSGIMDSGMGRYAGDVDFWKRAMDGRALREGRAAAAKARWRGCEVGQSCGRAVWERQNIGTYSSVLRSSIDFSWRPFLGKKSVGVSLRYY
jgi:hypothetical protein